jgi:uncharacterized protein (TIGR02217 family)
MAIRSTQDVIAALSASNVAYTLVTQQVIEVIADAASMARATQLSIEAIVAVTSMVRVTWFGIQALVWELEVNVTTPAIYPALPGLTYSVIKRPKWFTGVGTAATGREVRVAYAQNPLWEYELTYNVLHDKPSPAAATASDLKQLMGFYLAMNGSFLTFLFLDPDDNAVTGQIIGTTDGTTTTWTLTRTYGGSDGTGSEPIGYVNPGFPLNVYLDGALQASGTYTLLNTGLVNQQIRFATAPGAGHVISVDMNYYYVVRFAEDHYDFEKFMDKLWSLAKVTLMSQRG